jgi:hypothetical protein
MRAILWVGCTFLFFAAASAAQNVIPTNDPPFYGPYNGIFLPDGEGLRKLLVKNDTVMRADSAWTLYAWVYLDEKPKGLTAIAGLGDPQAEYSRYLGMNGESLILWAGQENSLSAAVSLAPGKWHFVAAAFDGHEFHLFSEASRVASGKLDLGSVGGVLEMAPAIGPWSDGSHFGGKIAGLTLLRRAITDQEERAFRSSRKTSRPCFLKKRQSHGLFRPTNKPVIAHHKIPPPCRVPTPSPPFL